MTLLPCSQVCWTVLAATQAAVWGRRPQRTVVLDAPVGSGSLFLARRALPRRGIAHVLHPDHWVGGWAPRSRGCPALRVRAAPAAPGLRDLRPAQRGLRPRAAACRDGPRVRLRHTMLIR